MSKIVMIRKKSEDVILINTRDISRITVNSLGSCSIHLISKPTSSPIEVSKEYKIEDLYKVVKE
jgi:hypothetical protein